MIVLVGNHFLLDETARETLKKRGFQPRDVPWLEGEEVTEAGITSHLQGGLFGPAALVVNMLGIKEYKPIVELIASAPDAVAIVLDPENWSSVETSSEQTRKKKAQEARAKHYEKIGAELQVLATPLKGALIAWIVARAKKMKLELASDAAKMLSEIFPDDPPAIASELEKLSLLEGKIDAQTVRRVVNHLPPTTIFAVQDAIAAKKPLEASEHLERLLNANEDPFKLLGGIQAQYNLLARAFALRQRDPMLNKDEAGKALSVHPFRAEKALFAAKKLSEAKLKTDLEYLLSADIGMKSGLDPRVTLERLILELSF